jgi:hypothetical protein
LVPKLEERKLLVNIHAQLGHLSERCSLDDVNKTKVIEFKRFSFLEINYFKKKIVFSKEF